MYFEINESGQFIRPLPGYYEGYHADLIGIDPGHLADIQREYLSIPIDQIRLASDKEISDYEARNSDFFSALGYLSKTDLLMSRVVEDIVELMVNKGLIDVDEIPCEAIERINFRKNIREKMKNS